MAITLVAVPKLVRVCDLGEERTRILRQRMEEHLVDDETSDLRI